MVLNGKKRKKKRSLTGIIGGLIFNSRGFPIFLTCLVLAVLFVLFRMKGVELDYEIVNVKREITKRELEKKGLNAKRAKLLSVKKLRGLAKKYGLERPKQDQIIVIP